MIRRLLEYTFVAVWLGGWLGCTISLTEKMPPKYQDWAGFGECVIIGVGWPAIVAYDATHALLSAPGA